MRHITMTAFVLLAAGLSVGLFWVKYQVQDLEDELAMLNRGIVTEQQTIRVLKAEWALLNDPSRLRGLAEKHLGLTPADVGQITQVETLTVTVGEGRP